MFGFADGNVRLIQISGGGRIRVGTREKSWWEKPGPERDWQIIQTDIGQTYDTLEMAERVKINLSKG